MRAPPHLAPWSTALLTLCLAARTGAAAECPAPVALTPLLLAAPVPLASFAAGSPSRLSLDHGPVTYAADDLAVTLPGGPWELTGHVEFEVDGKHLFSDRLVYDPASRSVVSAGPLRVRDDLLDIEGQSGRYGQNGSALERGQFHWQQRAGFGQFAHAEVHADRSIEFRDITYSGCPRAHADWQIHARAIRVDTDGHVGYASGATVRFLDVPLLYVPAMSFPLDDTRKSGVLFPVFGSSGRSGVWLGVPWYWNIAPNQDATFTPTYYSLRGLALGGEYRYLSASDQGTAFANWVPRDHDASDASRDYVRLLDRWQIDGATRLDIDAGAVSDDAYFEDYTQGTQATSTAFIARRATLLHRDDVWDWRVQTLGYQTIDNTLPLAARPAEELPSLTAAAAWPLSPWHGLRAGFGSEVVDFSRSTGFTGWRAEARPYADFDLTGAGYFVRSNVAVDYTRYEGLELLRDYSLPDSPPSTALGSPARALPIATVDTGLVLERPSGAGSRWLVTLEPRAMYTFIPYRDQSALPQFDTAVPDPNLIELFQPNRYVGPDRIGDSNGVTLGLGSKWFDGASGARYLSAEIGQTYYFSTPRVTLPGQEAANARTSDLIAELNISAYRHWNLQLNVASNPAVSRIAQTEAAVQYRPDGQQVANLAYRFQHGSNGFAQIDGSLAWPIGRHVDTYVRSVYSLRDQAPIDNFAGFQYHASCWNIRAVVQSAVLSHSTVHRDTGLLLELELTGLSSVRNGIRVGSDIGTFLEQSIRGYSATAPQP